VRRSTDLRIVLVQAYPEYRDTALHSTHVALTRTYAGLTDAIRDEGLSRIGFAPADGGGGWFRAPFTVQQLDAQTLRISLDLDADTVGKLYLAPTALSSEELGLYLPRSAPAAREDFEVTLHYASSPERARFIVRQAVRMLEGNQLWRVTEAPAGWHEQPDDGGPVTLPEDFVVTVASEGGARITWKRQRGQVWVTYRLETLR
jgi:hypothetical protein